MSEEAAAVTDEPQQSEENQNEPSDMVQALPEPDADTLSFTDALENALSKMDSASEQAPEAQTQSEPEPAPEPEATPEPEPTTEPEATPEAEAEPESDDSEKTPLDDLSEDIGDDWTPKAANRFKQLKEELRNSSSELETLRQKNIEHEAQIKELTALNETEDPKALQEKLAEYEQEKMFNNLEETEAYKNRVTEPLHELLEQTEAVAEKYGIDSEALIDAVAMEDEAEQDKALADLLSVASDRDKARIYRVVDSVEPIMEMRQAMYENVEQAVAEAKEADEQRSNQKIAQDVQIRSQVATEVSERVTEKLPFLKAIEGFDMATATEAAAKADPNTIHPVDNAYNAIASNILPTVVKEYVSMRKEVELLTDRLASYENAEPSSTSGAAVTANEAGKRTADNLSFEDAVNAAFAG